MGSYFSIEKWVPWRKAPNLDEVLSHERIERYLSVSDGDRQKAYDLYELNTYVSECLYVSMQMLEVTLRNNFNTCLAQTYGEDWYDQYGVITTIHQRQKITDAKLGLVREKKALTSGGIVASLTFGFWTSCLNNEYEDTLWRPALSKAFPNKPSKINRKAVNGELSPIRSLRNRIAHHEPILYWHLPKHHDNIVKMTGWLSLEARAWTERHCRFAKVYDADRAGAFIKAKRTSRT